MLNFEGFTQELPTFQKNGWAIASIVKVDTIVKHYFLIYMRRFSEELYWWQDPGITEYQIDIIATKLLAKSLPVQADFLLKCSFGLHST